VGRVLRLAAAGLSALVGAGPAAAHTDGGWGLTLAWPAQGMVTRGFGWDATMSEFHTGVDIGSLRSPDVVAAAPGVVEATGYVYGYEGYGKIVLVNVGGGLEALYAHLDSVAVPVGSWVAVGSDLGEAGCTGYCTGTHLHFEVRQDGVAIDPTPLLAST
jgi:murein DD-endopeptidase MepM/ murein hydrolase activator NlpD